MPSPHTPPISLTGFVGRMSLTKFAFPQQHRGIMAWWWWWPSSTAERLRRRAAAKRLQCQAKSALPLPPLAPGLDAAKENDIAVTATVEELVAQVKAAAQPGDHVLCMSNGGFDGVHAKLLQTL